MSYGNGQQQASYYYPNSYFQRPAFGNGACTTCGQCRGNCGCTTCGQQQTAWTNGQQFRDGSTWRTNLPDTHQMGTSQFQIVRGDSRVVKVDGIAVPQGATSYYFDANRKTRFLDANDKEVGGSHSSDSNGPTPIADGSNRPEATVNACQQQAGALPFKMENGKITLDPKSDAVKAFVKDQSPKMVGDLLAGLFDEKDSTQVRLDKLLEKPELRKTVFDTLALASRAENPNRFAEAVGKLFKLPAGLLKIGKSDYNFDIAKFKELDEPTQKLFREASRAGGNEVFDRYIKLFEGKENIAGWQEYCLVCTFVVGANQFQQLAAK